MMASYHVAKAKDVTGHHIVKSRLFIERSLKAIAMIICESTNLPMWAIFATQFSQSFHLKKSFILKLQSDYVSDTSCIR